MGAHIYSADVSITQIHGANGCTPEPTQLLVGGNFTAATSWPGPLGSQLDVASSGAGDQCPSNLSNRIHFTGAGTVNYLQKAADTGNGLLSFGLLAVNEGDWTQWKRFNYDAQVAVTFNYPPSGPVATGVAAPAFRCGATTYVPSRTVQLGGTATDNNSPVLPLKLTYNVYVGANPNPAAILTSSPVASGSTAMATINFASDGDFQYDVQASNNVGTSGGSDLSTGKSGRVAFTVDTLPPAGTPTISSEDYPRDFWGSPANQGVFTLTDGSATTAVGFVYSWDDPASIQKPSNTTCGYTMPNGTTGGWVADTGGTASLKVPAGLTVAPYTLYVRDFDAGHNMSAGTIGNGMASYHFYVSPFTYPQETTARYEGDLNFGTVATTAGVSVDSNNAPTTVGTASAYRESGAGLGWSGNAQEHLTASAGIPFDPTKPAQHGPQFKFTFTAPIDADYAFGVKMTKFNHYGQVQFSLTDNSTSTINTFKDPNTSTPVTFDGYSPTVITEYRVLGGQHMTAGNHTLTVTVVGKNPSSADNGAGDGGFSAGLDYFTIVPINNVVYAGYYQGQNNNGIANDGTAANLDFKNNSISENSLLAAGWQFGANPVVDNVPFHITAPYAGGLDNIVATGQTITEGSGTTVPNYLDLLVLSTNGNTQSNATTQVTINYSPPQSQPSGTYNTVVMPSVPDWYSAPLKAPVIGSADGGTTTSSTMTNAFPITAQTPQSPLYVNNGVTPNHSIHPMIYHIRINLALNQLLNGNGYPVKSITLPNYNTAFLPSQNALHVLAITYNTN